MPSLRMKEGPLAGQRVAVEARLLLGRTNADLTIDDPLVSTRHALLRRVDKALEIEDLGSLNGTWVNGERITAPRRLEPGDVIKVGGTSIDVQADPEDVATVFAAPDAVRAATERAEGGAPALVVKNGALARSRFGIADELTVGRENADVAFDAPEISRRHAVLRAVGDDLLIEDAGSLNGTWVNGSRVEGPTLLENGDVISIGPILSVVDYPQAPRRATVIAPRPRPTALLTRHVVTEDSRRWLALATVTFPLFMVMLDTTIVNVALPSIQVDLKSSLASLEWTVSAYMLAEATFLLAGGKLADFLGRRRIFLLGLLVFMAASIAAGFATSATMLVIMRGLQGAGAALMIPSSESIIAATFAPEERGMAYGIWVGASATGLGLGPVAGGALIEALDWRWIFYVNVPLGAVAFLMALLVVRESRDTSAEQRLDLPGLLFSGAALFGLVFGLIEGNRFGWTSPVIIACFVGAAIALTLFVLIELRSRFPLFDLSLLRNATFAGANIVVLLVTVALFGVLFFVSLFLQNILGYSALKTGAALLPLTLLFMVVAPVAGKLTDKFGPKYPIAGGMALLTVSLTLLSRLGQDASFASLMPPLIVGGVGVGLTMAPTNAASMAAVPLEKAGVGAGVLNTFRQSGGALGIAMMGALLTTRVGDLTATDRGFPQAFMEGYERAMLLGAAATLVATIVAAVLIGRPPRLQSAQPARVPGLTRA